MIEKGGAYSPQANIFQDYFFRAIVDSQQNEEECTEISHILPCIHSLPHDQYAQLCPSGTSVTTDELTL